jgi:hypothetical protein
VICKEKQHSSSLGFTKNKIIIWGEIYTMAVLSCSNQNFHYMKHAQGLENPELIEL